MVKHIWSVALPSQGLLLRYSPRFRREHIYGDGGRGATNLSTVIGDYTVVT